jgi:two-component system, NarL family, nitrate/nitrite response regulator NarL
MPTSGPINKASPDLSGKRRIRVVIADDHPITRESIKRLFAREDDLQVVGEAGDGREVLACLEELEPDVLLLDLAMPNVDGMSVLRSLHATNCPTKVILFTASEDKTAFVQAMRLGCFGIVQKQAELHLLVKSIRKVYAGEIWLDFATTGAVMRQFSVSLQDTAAGKTKALHRSVLSPREEEIVALVALGYRNKELASKLSISEQTVKNHLHNIFDKLRISDRLELALYAIHNGIHLSKEMSA